MQLETIFQPWRLARKVNQTSSSFVSKLPTLTEPTGDAGTATGASIIELGKPREITQNGLLLLPFGTGSDATTFSVNIIGWAQGAFPNAGNLFSWFPLLLAQLQCTISSTNTAPASGFTPNGASDFFASAISLTYGNNNVSIDIVSPGVAGLLASALLDIKGFQKIELSFSTGSSATDANALVRFV
jgi:hypothetical protein